MSCPQSARASDAPRRGLELADHGPVAAESEVGCDARLEPLQAQLLQPPDLRLREVLERHLRQRRTAPQRERGARRVRRGGRIAGIEVRSAPGHPVLEGLRVQISLRDREHVPAAHRPQDGATCRRGLQRGEALAQPRDRHLHALERTAGVAGVPQGFVELLIGDRAVGVQQEEREQRHLSRAAERHAAVAGARLERSEDRERHAVTGGCSMWPRCCRAWRGSRHAPDHALRLLPRTSRRRG